MKRKKRGSVFAGLLVFVLLVVVACTVAVNLIFSSNRVPHVAGYYLYLQDSADMEPAIPEKSLVAAEAAVISELHEGNKVLCYLSDGTLALRNIYKIEETEDGTVNYYPGTAVEQGTDLVIPRTNIFAVCVWASPELYQYIKFATTVNGLMALLVAPCVLLIFMLLVHIARNGSEDMEDEEFAFEEDDEEEDEKPVQPKKKKAAAENPLYDPEKVAAAKLEEKKSSISENFSPKPVNENSPYQKAVQEREKTMKVRRQEIEEEALRALETPMPRQKKSNTQIYSTQEIREQAALQAQQPNPAPVPAAPAPPPPSMHTASVPQPVVMPQNPAPVPVQPQPVQAPAPAEQKKPEPPKPAPAKPVYSSPNIDDILQADKKSKSEIASSDSIDDLIRLIEKEKNKL
ncbi:MAG: hypothetical protein IJ642_13950 [Oscillospiraceae bacterium]|nr:hypothetical protein [Oscillospiraceae bacterium]